MSHRFYRVFISLSCLGLLSCSIANARGGFGGGSRGFSGGMRGDFARPDMGMRSDSFGDFNRGFDHPHDDGPGRIDDGGLGGFADRDRPDAFSSPHDWGRSGDPMDNGVKDYGAQRSLASDGGFASIMHGAAAPMAHLSETARITPANLSRQATNVRHNFNDYNLFRNDWWRNHPNAWWNIGWDDYWPWRWGSWNDFAGFWGVPFGVLPVYYDYGDNIVYGDSGYVNYGDQPICTASDYYQQSYDLANSVSDDDFGESASAGMEISAPAAGAQQASSSVQAKAASKNTSGEWKPFGVYSLVQGGQNNSSTIFQLCSNKKGQIRGNYYNALTNETQLVKGAVDKRTMRAAWTVGKNSSVVYDTGVANLLKDQSPLLIHFGKDSTQQWTLVRIKNPNSEKSGKS